MKGTDDRCVHGNDLHNNEDCNACQAAPARSTLTAWSQFDRSHTGQDEDGDEVTSLHTRDLILSDIRPHKIHSSHDQDSAGEGEGEVPERRQDGVLHNTAAAKAPDDCKDGKRQEIHNARPEPHSKPSEFTNDLKIEIEDIDES